MLRPWIPALFGCGALLCCGATSAGDWQPPAAPPRPAGPANPAAAPGYPAPPAPAYGMPPGYGPVPSSAGPAGADYDPETGRVSFDFAGLRVTQQRTDDAYLLDIALGDLPAAHVVVRPLGGGLLLAVRHTAETSRAETLAEGQGYRRSWSYSSGQRSRRLPAPPDADLMALERQDTAERISIRIPRRDLGLGAGPMPWEPPAAPPPAAPAPATGTPETAQ